MDENATRHHTGTDPAGAGTRTHDQSRGQQQSGTADQAMQQANSVPPGFFRTSSPTITMSMISSGILVESKRTLASLR